MRERYEQMSPERKDVLLVLYLLGFAILTAAMYVYPVLAFIMLFGYPSGAMLFGCLTGDSIRAFLAGTFSYVFLVLLILLSPGFAMYPMDTAYLARFTGYHLILPLCLGLIGWMASKKESLPRILALPLAALWILLFLSGIS